MAYISVDVEVDLSEFNTEELVEELEYRLKEKSSTTMKCYIDRKLVEKLNGLDISNLNILDESKLNYFLENFDKITEEQLKQIVEK